MEDNEKLFFDTDDDWNDIDFSDLTDEPAADEDTEPTQEDTAEVTEEHTEEEPADKPTEGETTEEPTETEPSAENEPETDHSFVLKYMGEDKEYSREETTTLAQKGLDYDRQRKKAEDLQAEKTAMQEALTKAQEALNTTQSKAEFLDELAKAQNITTEDLMMNVRSSIYARENNVTNDVARERVAFAEREKQLKAREEMLNAKTQEERQEDAAKESRNKEFLAFFEAHRSDNDGNGVSPHDIPKECFLDMAKGIPLETSYRNYVTNKEIAAKQAALDSRSKELEELIQQNKELQAKLEHPPAPSQNEINQQRSVGSASSSGKAPKDAAFDALWYDDN